jgi:hypothetical protein
MRELLKKITGPTQTIDGRSAQPVTIRYARPDDALALMDLAELDSAHAPQGVVLVAEVNGKLWAAQSVEDGHAVADPFRPSGELAFLLSERARQLHAAARHGGERRQRALLAA